MKTLKLFITTAIVGLFMSSCSKETGVDNTNIAPPNVTAFKELREKALKDIAIIKIFNTSAGIDFTTTKGTKVTFSPNSIVDQSNQSFLGNVSFSIADIYDRGTMVVTNKALMGKDAQGNLRPLVTGGQIFTELKSENTSVKLSFGNFYNIQMPSAHTEGIDIDMKSWTGNINSDGNLEWEENMPWSHDVVFSTPNLNVGNYNIALSKFGWFNIDRFYPYIGNTTKIKLKAPLSYNKQNSSVYIAFSGEPEVLAQLNEYNPIDAYFTENYGFSPIGMTIHIIFVTESNGNLAYALKTTTVTANQLITINQNDIQQISSQNLVNLVNQLN